MTGALPLPSPEGQRRLTIDWTRCRGHGLCAHIVPELMQLDEQGYPVPLNMAVPPWLERGARQAVDMCPALALRLVQAPASPAAPVTLTSSARASARACQRPALADAAPSRVITGKVVDLAVSEEWIADLAAIRRS